VELFRKLASKPGVPKLPAFVISSSLRFPALRRKQRVDARVAHRIQGIVRKRGLVQRNAMYVRYALMTVRPSSG
jgi:hypothetical protein